MYITLASETELNLSSQRFVSINLDFSPYPLRASLRPWHITREIHTHVYL